MERSFNRKHALLGMWLPVCLLACPLSPAHAQEAWKVGDKLQGEPKREGFKKSKDVSGIACDRSLGFPRLCLVVDDETQGAQIVILNDGELVAGDFIRLTKAQFDGELLELDAEGVAFDSGSFYVAGSHGRKRHNDSDPKEEAENNAKAQTTRQVFRITMDASGVDMKTGKLVDQPAIKRSTDLSAVLKRQPDLASSFNRALKDNGMTIEGIAVRNGRLYAGMRGPVLDANAAVASMSLAAVFDGEQTPPELHKLALGRDSLDKPRGVRDIIRYADGFLVLAGPQHDPPDNREIQSTDYSIYEWNKAGDLKRVMDVPVFGKEIKPEALLPLDGEVKRGRILILFDGPKGGAPRPFEITLD